MKFWFIVTFFERESRFATYAIEAETEVGALSNALLEFSRHHSGIWCDGRGRTVRIEAPLPSVEDYESAANRDARRVAEEREELL